MRDVHFTYPGADEVSLASLESVARPDSRGRGEPVLRGLDFRIEPGQMYALVGPSGAGKSTITALVTRLYDVSSGAVLVGDTDVRDATLASLSDVIGVVTQDSHMFHDSIRGNLTYARPGATDDNLWLPVATPRSGTCSARCPTGWTRSWGSAAIGCPVGRSSGWRSPGCCSRRPNVVVLDEATAHLDSESEAAVQRALATALAGRTSLVVAHRLSTIRAADQILVIDGGLVVQRGTHEELLAAGGLYADLSRTQFGLDPDSDAPVDDADLAYS